MDKAADILVVDDQEQVIFHLHTVLSEQGYKVRTAKDGHQALAMMRRQKPDLVISDFRMPGLDGFEMLRLLQGDAQLGDIPVIVITGKPLDASTRSMVEMEPNVKKLFPKPVDVVGLLKAVREALGGGSGAVSSTPADDFQSYFPNMQRDPKNPEPPKD
ncbi:MAG: response regulator [Elusimicrobia bacterium]|nr:response regulator [Elusimicrobiota bacterium]